MTEAEALALAPEFLGELPAGSREADKLVAQAIGWTSRIHKPQTNYDMEWEEWIPPGDILIRGSTQVPQYSRDLTAAFNLDPGGAIWCLSGRREPPLTYWFDVHMPDGTSHVAVHACREMAVCVGFLKARRALHIKT